MSASLRRQARSGSPRAGPPTRWPVRGTSSTCAISTPRRCGRCWMSRPTTSARGVSSRPLAGKTLALIFEKPSTRTRVSFEVGMRQLGGDVVVLNARDMQSGRGESPADTARVLSRYVDAIMLRTDHVSKLHELAQYATVPVINGLTDTSHPVPAHGRRDDVRGASRPDRRPGGRLVRRRQQRRAQLDRGGGAVRLHAAPGDARCAASAR